MQLFSELTLLGCVFLASAALTAVMVGLSACGSILVRGILPVFGTPLLVIFVFAMCLEGLDDMLEFFVLGTAEARVWFGSCFALTIYLTWTALDFGASMIAPLAENRATRRRLIATAVTLGVAALGFWVSPSDSPWIILALGLVLTPALVVSLTEASELLPVHTRPFRRLGFAGRLLGRALYPGWPGGVIFSGLLYGLAAIFAYGVLDVPWHTQPEIACVSWLGTILFPAALIALFRRKISNPFATYMLITAATGVLTFIVILLAEAMRAEILAWIFCWLPSCHLAMTEVVHGNDDVILILSVAVTLCYAVVLLVAALTRFPAILRAERDGPPPKTPRLPNHPPPPRFPSPNSSHPLHFFT